MTDAEAGESLPKFMWVPAADVAKAAVEGLAAGRPVVIPGAANRAAAALAHLAPKSLLLPLLAQRHPALKPDATDLDQRRARRHYRDASRRRAHLRHDRGPHATTGLRARAPLPRHGRAGAPEAIEAIEGGPRRSTGWPAPTWATR